MAFEDSNDSPGPLTGYYRASDILFHYHQSLKNTRDAVQLQKLFSHDAVLHPRHPLAADGVKGIQGYIGTWDDGQARVLFSSAQVDYLRYWMHAMQLAQDLLPLPYSDCMFVDVRVVSPTVFESLGALSATSKKLGRMNQYLKENPLLVGRRSRFERVRTLWSAKEGVWCALSFDAWEVDHTAISDVGWSLVRWESGTEISQRGHLVVKENQTYKKTQIEDGSDIQLVSKATSLKGKVNDLFSELRQHGPVFLVSNDVKGDLNYLRSKALQVPLEDLASELPESMPSAGVFIVDPTELFHALSGGSDSETDRNALARICKHLHINFGDVQNAGTTAECSLHALRSMASGPQLDAQREQRWPNQTELQVQFKAWEDDPSHDDLEGLIPPLNKSC
ncbi:hypothetical protein DFH07DRAFT_810980 [Mycena maculata]|uniref:Gfd2/YDR514C-like C-terminal domain-containing protein n=1 Tax=Mycena maculata TaxID=230809 RepID=A0AAD7NKL4_9AGAR|nr:hypothetical protein DFH07DRAFT_810980 [Mycena maculata]